MLNTRTNRYYSPEELEGEDDIPVDIETLDGEVTVYLDDLNIPYIFQRLGETIVRSINYNGRYIVGPLLKVSRNSTLIPSTWTDAEINLYILKHYQE